MDANERQYRAAATKKGLSLARLGPDAWSLGPPVSSATLIPGRPIEPSETLLTGDRFQLPDGRIFKLTMTTAELRAALGFRPVDATPTGESDTRE